MEVRFHELAMLKLPGRASDEDNLFDMGLYIGIAGTALIIEAETADGGADSNKTF